MEPIEPQTVHYIGPSMNPTLRSGDRLEVIPYNGEKIRRGDVVVCVPLESDSRVIHRVVSASWNGIRTRGDNCNFQDDWVLRRHNIIGRVVSVQRRKRRFRVLGGSLGHSLAKTIRAIKCVDTILSSLLRPFYQRLARAGVFRRWLPACMKTKAICLSHPAGTELQLVMGKRVIGRWLPGMTRWHIRRPYRLFVDETSLPENNEEVSGVGFRVSGTDKAEVSGFRCEQ